VFKSFAGERRTPQPLGAVLGEMNVGAHRPTNLASRRPRSVAAVCIARMGAGSRSDGTMTGPYPEVAELPADTRGVLPPANMLISTGVDRPSDRADPVRCVRRLHEDHVRGVGARAGSAPSKQTAASVGASDDEHVAVYSGLERIAQPGEHLVYGDDQLAGLVPTARRQLVLEGDMARSPASGTRVLRAAAPPPR
jgi:hypothetical protein